MDTNVLLRLLQPDHVQYRTAAAAVRKLRQQQTDLCIAPQNLVEFWNVTTRPAANNGLAKTADTATSELLDLLALFRLLDGKPGVTEAWQNLISKYSVLGKQAHDAHLVAVMQIHEIPCILTFNISDFSRYREITVLDPTRV